MVSKTKTKVKDEECLFLHNKTYRLYSFICEAKYEDTKKDAVVYKSLETQKVFVRPATEFYDGRFTRITKNGY